MVGSSLPTTLHPFGSSLPTTLHPLPTTLHPFSSNPNSNPRANPDSFYAYVYLTRPSLGLDDALPYYSAKGQSDRLREEAHHQVGLDTGTVGLTVKTSFSHLITQKFNIWGVECTLAVIGKGGPSK
eukprot:1182856-Prorocentrum_minimum.AAC.2